MLDHKRYSIRKYIACSKEERVACASVIYKIIRLANIARNEGVLPLEQEAEKTDDPVLKRGLFLVVDGTDPHLVEEILHVSNVYSSKTGSALLRSILYLEGILCIQAGTNPRIIEELLLSYLGEDAYEDARALLKKIEAAGGCEGFLKELKEGQPC